MVFRLYFNIIAKATRREYDMKNAILFLNDGGNLFAKVSSLINSNNFTILIIIMIVVILFLIGAIMFVPRK